MSLFKAVQSRWLPILIVALGFVIVHQLVIHGFHTTRVSVKGDACPFMCYHCPEADVASSSSTSNSSLLVVHDWAVKKRKEHFVTVKAAIAADAALTNQYSAPPHVWDMIEPTAQCLEEERIGRLGDGGKWTCGLLKTKQTPCIVYSIGSAGDFSFERDILAFTQNDCVVHVFDPEPSYGQGLSNEPNIIYHAVYVDSLDFFDDNGKKHQSLPTIMKENGHQHIDLLKFDAEGAEWRSLPQLMALFKFKKVPISQMQIEFHYQNSLSQWLDMVALLESYGFVIFHREPNPWCYHCHEYAFGNLYSPLTGLAISNFSSL